MFCAAVPTVAALGLAARAEQKEKMEDNPQNKADVLL
jgi:hypothetical protein